MSRSDAVDAADRIAQRRYDQRDDQRSGLAYLPAELFGVVVFVHVYPAVAADLRAADAADAALILDHLRGELDRQRLAAYRLGLGAGLTWSKTAALFGKRSRQAAEGEYQRLLAAVEQPDGVKDEKIARLARARQREDAVRAAGRARLIRELGVALVVAGDRIPDGLDAGYGVEELRIHLTRDCLPGDVPPAGMVAGLRLLVAALREMPLDVKLRATVDDGAQLLDEAGR